MTLDLVGVHEMADIFGVTWLALSSASFPPPATTIAAARIWLGEEVEGRASATARLPRQGSERAWRHQRRVTDAG